MIPYWASMVILAVLGSATLALVAWAVIAAAVSSVAVVDDDEIDGQDAGGR